MPDLFLHGQLMFLLPVRRRSLTGELRTWGQEHRRLVQTLTLAQTFLVAVLSAEAVCVELAVFWCKVTLLVVAIKHLTSRSRCFLVSLPTSSFPVDFICISFFFPEIRCIQQVFHRETLRMFHYSDCRLILASQSKVWLFRVRLSTCWYELSLEIMSSLFNSMKTVLDARLVCWFWAFVSWDTS